MATRQEVLEFLSMIKGAMCLDLFDVTHREKNMQVLLDLGVSHAERREILLALTPEDYVDGPTPDHVDPTKDVWIFGADIEGMEVYVKLRLSKVPGKRTVYRALVWSFHPARHPMEYPFRGDMK